MRTGRSPGLDKLYLEHMEPLAPLEGEILVRVRASSLNFHDLGIVTGALPVDPGRIPLSDCSGNVVDIGPGVTRFAPGDRVLSTFFPEWADGAPSKEQLGSVPGDHRNGFAADYVTMPETAFTRPPAGYSHAEAATLPCAAVTAWRALFINGGLRPGDTVLVQGSGGVSLFALQFAKAAGATVIATSSSSTKLARLRALGADHVINYLDEPNWGSVTRALTGGVGVDHVVEVGGSGTFYQSLSAVRNGGHVAVIGVLAGRAGPIPTALIMAKQVRVIGLTVGSRAHQLDVVDAIESSRIRPIIDRVFELDRLAEAFAHQQSGRHFGKIVIRVHPGEGDDSETHIDRPPQRQSAPLTR
jgi:NADPH:quinone reductase-like Zn-dependent oxidoreductase